MQVEWNNKYMWRVWQNYKRNYAVEIYDRWRKKSNNEESWWMNFMKTFLVICLVAIIISGLYYLVKSLVIVGLLTVIGIGLYFWISKKLKSWMNENTLVSIFEPLVRKKNHYTHARGQIIRSPYRCLSALIFSTIQ